VRPLCFVAGFLLAVGYLYLEVTDTNPDGRTGVLAASIAFIAMGRTFD
jgi:hypothetical protein